VGRSHFEPIVSTALLAEYEDVLKRPGLVPALTGGDVDDFLDYFLSESIPCKVHFLWRPQLRDAGDDMLLELAVAGGAEFIVTHNLRHFGGTEAFGTRAVTPTQFLHILKVI
jgi:predicted nucleic acid-binding protein